MLGFEHGLPLSYLMELLDFILHVDQHLAEFITNYGVWIYGILFFNYFCRNRFSGHAVLTGR